MSFLYPKKEDIKTSCDITQENGKINLTFYSNCGKFGTDEILDIYDLTPDKLLSILQNND